MREGHRAAGSEVIPRAQSGLCHQPQGLPPPTGTPAVHKLFPSQAELGWGPDPRWGHRTVSGSWVKVTSGVPRMENRNDPLREPRT